MSFLTLIVIQRINSFMFSLIMSFTSTMMDSLRSFIITDIYSFQLTDVSESESSVISSWVSRIFVLLRSLTWIIEYFGNGICSLPEPRPPRSPPYLAQTPLFLPPRQCGWVSGGLFLCGGVNGCWIFAWNDVIGTSFLEDEVQLFPLTFLSVEQS